MVGDGCRSGMRRVQEKKILRQWYRPVAVARRDQMLKASGLQTGARQDEHGSVCNPDAADFTSGNMLCPRPILTPTSSTTSGLACSTACHKQHFSAAGTPSPGGHSGQLRPHLDSSSPPLPCASCELPLSTVFDRCCRAFPTTSSALLMYSTSAPLLMRLISAS